MDFILIGYLILLLIIFTVTAIATKKFLLGLMVLLIFTIIGYILTILPKVSIILIALIMSGIVAYYLFMKSSNQYGIYEE